MRKLLSIVTLAVLSFGTVCSAKDYVWTGAAKDGLWSTPANWTPSSDYPHLGDNVVFPKASANTTVKLNGDQAVRSVTFDPAAPFSYTIEGNTLTLDDGGSVRFLKLPTGSAAVMAVTCNIHLAGNATFGNANVWYFGEERLSIRGRLSGSGVITIGELDGCVEFAGDNTDFTGSIVIARGSLVSNHKAALGSGKADVVLTGGSLWFGGGLGPITKNFQIAGNAVWSCITVNGPHEGDITVKEGTTWTLDDGGSGITLRGVIAGKGNLQIVGSRSILTGSKPNTLAGTVGVRGATTLSKPAGVNALASPIVLEPNGKIRWAADEQVADNSPVKFAGDMSVLELNSHRETLGTVDLQGHGFIQCGDGTDVLHAADSHAIAWNGAKELIVTNWKGDKNGGGVDQIAFGNGPDALTTVQLGRIGFRNPAGLPAGLYTAAILKTGELIPAAAVVAVNPPYDLSAKAKAERQKVYEVAGRANLVGKATPLKKDMKIAFFGDSITWGGGYIATIDQAIKSGEGTRDLGVKLINHGVNGGGALTLRDGDDTPAGSTSHAGGTKPRPFAEYLAEDKPDVAVIYIGVNDIWWRKTTPEAFEKAMSDLVTTAKANKTVPVLATLSVLGDSPSTDNANGPKCDEYAQITRKVAAETGTTLVDLRKAFIAYLQNNNPELRLDGSLRFSPTGILTADGVHPNEKGNDLTADEISQGIFEALRK